MNYVNDKTYEKAEEYFTLFLNNHPELPDAVDQLELLSNGKNSFSEFEIIKIMALMLSDQIVHLISETDNAEEKKVIASFVFRMGRIYERIYIQMEMISQLN